MRLILFLTLLLAAPASAATVEMRDQFEREGGRTYAYGVIVVTAASGEANTLGVTAEPGAVVITDATAPLTGDARCAKVDEHTVRCDGSGLAGITEVDADLGDGADRATALEWNRLPWLRIRGGTGDDVLEARAATLEGGDGDDVLRGGDGKEILHGDAGNDLLEGLGDGDYLHGGAGDDVLRGGDGHDNLLGGTTVYSDQPAGTDRLEGGAGNDSLDDQDGIGRRDPGPDHLSGGDGQDSVYSYVLRTAPVTIDLSGGVPSGEPSENDTLDGIEDASGGYGNDTLIGDGGPNRLDGDRGRDVIRGGGGADLLVSDVNPREDRRDAATARRYGPDRVSGGDGNDTVETLGALQSEIACGRGGRDRIRLTASGASRGPLVDSTCERLDAGRLTFDPFPVVIGTRRLLFRVLSGDGPARVALKMRRVRGGREFRVAHQRFGWRVRVRRR